MMAKIAHAGASREPLAAAQPVSGGRAPGTAPINVQSEVRVFAGVYAKR